MPKVRQDAWSHEDDLLLAETVLRHIREGSTQLKAFDEVGDVLNRTSAACGFRWNAEVRQKYEQAVELAKKQRKEKKREEAKQPVFYQSPTQPAFTVETSEEIAPERPVKREPEPSEELQISDVIQFLQDLEHQSSSKNRLEVTRLEEEKEKLSEQNRQLVHQLESMKEDYQALIQIMDRARKMVMFEEQDYSYKPQFRMEKNGNLENVAK